MSFNTCSGAASAGNLNELKRLYLLGKSWNNGTTLSAAEGGHLECLRFAHQNGCSWDYLTTVKAAEKGHLDCLRYAHENGCEWTAEAPYFAAANGHLDCLKYALDNGCPFDNSITAKAGEKGQLECLKYAHMKGCQITKEVVKIIAFRGHIDCFKYCFEVYNKSAEFFGNSHRSIKWGNDNAYFDTTVKLDNLIDKIDLSDIFWKPLLNMDLKEQPLLKRKIVEYNEKIRILMTELEGIMGKDVINRVISNYL